MEEYDAPMTLEEQIGWKRAGVLYRSAERGSKFMDKKSPGWEDKINIEFLRMQSASSCICGQAFMKQADLENTTGYGFAAKYFTSIGSHRLGFSVPNKYWKDDMQWEYLALCWITQIEKRRAEKGQMV